MAPTVTLNFAGKHKAILKKNVSFRPAAQLGYSKIFRPPAFAGGDGTGHFPQVSIISNLSQKAVGK